MVSPIDGRVSRYYVTMGNLVVQDQTLLTTIVSVDPIYAYFDVDESTVLHVRELIRTGKMQSAREVSVPAWLSLTSDDGFPHEGTINFVDNQVNPKTGTLRVRGVFSEQRRSAFARLLSSACGCASACRIRRCWSANERSRRTKAKRSSTWSTRRTKSSIGRFASAHATAA